MSKADAITANVEALMADPIIVQIAREQYKGLKDATTPWHTVRDVDGQPTAPFMEAALRAYQHRGGTQAGFIGGPAQAILQLIDERGDELLQPPIMSEDDELEVVPLADVPWATMRRRVQAPKEVLRRGDRQAVLVWLRDHAHEVWRGEGYTYYVLKSYQADRDQPFARAMVLVDGPHGTDGPADNYWNEIMSGTVRIR